MTARKLTRERLLEALRAGHPMPLREVAKIVSCGTADRVHALRCMLDELIADGLVSSSLSVSLNGVRADVYTKAQPGCTVAAPRQWSPFEGDLTATGYIESFAAHRALCEELRKR